MKKLLTLAAISIMSLSTATYAETSSDFRLVVGQDRVNIEGKMNLSDGNNTMFKGDSESEAIGFALRTHFTESWGSELRYVVGSTDYFSSAGQEFAMGVDSTLFLSGLYKGPSLGQLGQFVPYAKLGLGVVSVDFNNEQVKEATYTAGLGVDYNVSESIVLGVEYEHFGDIDVAGDMGLRGEYGMSRFSVNLGIRF